MLLLQRHSPRFAPQKAGARVVPVRWGCKKQTVCILVLQLLSVDGQTIDNDIKRRADTFATSVLLLKFRQHPWPKVSFVGNSVTGSPPSSEGKQFGQARVDVQYCSGPEFSTFLRSKDDLVSAAERVQQQAVEVPVPRCST